jgi:2-methylcitrate dehydratase
VTGPSPIFEGDFGFIRYVSGPLELELDADRDRTADTYLKRFPAVYHAQGPLEMVLDLRSEMAAALGGSDVAPHIEDIFIEIYAFGVTWGADSPGKWRPRNRETADHSIPFMVALAFFKGEIDHGNLDAAIHDESILALTQRVRVVAEPTFTPRWPKEAPSRISVHAGGRTFIREITAPFGHLTRPMPSAKVDEKFLEATAHVMNEKAARDWLSRLRRFDTLPTVTEALRVPHQG